MTAFISRFFNVCLFLLCFSTVSFAQSKGITIKGQVVEGATQSPVEFATIMIGDKQTKTPITGTTTDLEGNFRVETKAQNFFIEISFIGYAAVSIDNFAIEQGKVDLGTITLGENSQLLKEVVVRAEKSTTEFKLDKRVFNCLLYTSPSPRDRG